MGTKVGVTVVQFAHFLTGVAGGSTALSRLGWFATAAAHRKDVCHFNIPGSQAWGGRGRYMQRGLVYVSFRPALALKYPNECRASA